MVYSINMYPSRNVNTSSVTAAFRVRLTFLGMPISLLKTQYTIPLFTFHHKSGDFLNVHDSGYSSIITLRVFLFFSNINNIYFFNHL